jgi:hypothetical protein
MRKKMFKANIGNRDSVGTMILIFENACQFCSTFNEQPVGLAVVSPLPTPVLK